MFLKKSSGGVDWLLVGLGNPGDKYENTRHNAGYMVVDEIGNRKKIPIQKLKYKALTNTTELGGQKVLVMKPVTYMNLSGEAVRQAADFYKIPAERILVISDDTALAIGKLRIRKNGSAGGHNGIKSIIYQLNSDQFPRVKIGIGESGRDREDTADFVLSPLSSDSYEGVKAAPQAVLDIIEQGVDYAMQRANSKKPAKEQKEVK